MIVAAAWQVLLGLLGVAHPFLAKRVGVGPWWLVAAQAIVGLRACLFGVWGLIQCLTMPRLPVDSWLLWPRHFAESAWAVALPALFATTLLAALLGHREPDGTNKLARKLSLAQLVVGALGVLAAAGALALDLDGWAVPN